MDVMTIMIIVLHCKLSAHQPNVHFAKLYFDHYFICHKVTFCGKMYHGEIRLFIVNWIYTLDSRVKPYRNKGTGHPVVSIVWVYIWVRCTGVQCTSALTILKWLFVIYTVSVDHWLFCMHVLYYKQFSFCTTIIIVCNE